jgi:tagaturonate reductase
VLSDTGLWGINLTEFPHFEETVNQKLQQIIEKGALKALEISAVLDNKTV